MSSDPSAQATPPAPPTIHEAECVIGGVRRLGAITEAQVPLAEAAKQAGVKLFLPSEYGEKTDTLEGGILLPKKLFQDKLRALGLPFALIYNGPFPDFVLTP